MPSTLTITPRQLLALTTQLKHFTKLSPDAKLSLTDNEYGLSLSDSQEVYGHLSKPISTKDLALEESEKEHIRIEREELQERDHYYLNS